MTVTQKQENQFVSIYNEAHTAGMKAATAHQPTPMAVFNADPLTGRAIGNPIEVVASGVCGFAWVTIKKATGFGGFLRKKGLAYKNGGRAGVTVWASGFGQSYEKKLKYARAFAEVLRSHGIECYADDRLD